MSDRARAFPDMTWENLAISEAEDRRLTHTQLRRQVTPELAQRTADLSFAYPQVRGGVIAGMAQAGINPLTPEADSIRDRSQELAEAGFSFTAPRQSFWDHGLGRQVKGFTRGAFTLFESLYDEVVKGGSAFIYGLGQGKSIPEAAESSFGYSAGAIAAASALQGRPVNLGQGFFAGGDLSPETQAALDRGVPYDEAIRNRSQMQMGLPARQHSLASQQEGFQKLAGTSGITDENTGISGLTLTPGRFIAAGVTEPGTWAFNQLSGVTDFAANIFLDPAAALGGAAADVRHLNGALVGGSHRPTVLARNVDNWLASGHGHRVAQFIAETDDYRTLHGLFRKNATESNVDASFIYALQQANDPVRVKELLSSAVSGGSSAGQLRQLPVAQGLIGRATGTSGLAGVIARGVGASGSSVDVLGLRAAIKANRSTTSFLGRMGAEVGAGVLRFDDISTAVDDLGQWLTAAGAKPEDISRHMSQMASIAPGQVDTAPRMWGAFKAAADTVAQRMVDNGMDPEVSNALVKTFRSLDDDRKFWINNAGEPTMFAGSQFEILANGQMQAIPSAQLFSEFMDWGIPLPDMRRIRKGLRRAAWANAGVDIATSKIENVREAGQILPRFKLRDLEGWDDLGPGVLTTLTDNLVQKVWKPLVLLRVAWPVRVVAEEQVRLAAAGMDSAVRHPISWLGMAFGRKMSDDILGNPWEEIASFQAAHSRKGGTFGVGRRPRDLYSGEWQKVKQGDPRYWEGQAVNLQQIADDPLIARMAKAIHEAEDGVSIEEILRPIKDEFATSGTELGRYRDALAADSSNWSVVNIRELSDSVIDDRYARLVQMTGGDYVKANHITGDWEDAFGNPVVYKPEIDSYVNTVTGQTYTNLPPPTRRGHFEVRSLPDRVESSTAPLMDMTTRAKTLRFNDPAGARLTDDPAELGAWVDSLEEFEDVLTKVDNLAAHKVLTDSRERYGSPAELARWIDRHVDEILDGDPQVTRTLATRLDDLERMMDDVRTYATHIEPPSGRANFRAAEIIEISGQPDLVRSRLAGYTPLPGQPTLDELANKGRWSLDEVRDMIGPSLGDLGRFDVRPMPPSMVDEFGTGTHIWTEPIDPRHHTRGELVYISHDGVITGHMQIKRAPDGTVEDIGILQTARGNERTVWYDQSGTFYRDGAGDPGLISKQLPGQDTDAALLLRHAMGENASTEDIYDLAFGGVSIREWLESAGHGPSNALGLNDLAEYMRVQFGAKWAGREGPLGVMPSIELTSDGASSLARALTSLGRRSQQFEGSVASWPQRGVTAHAVRPPKPELVEAVAAGRLGDMPLSVQGLLDETDKVARIDGIASHLRTTYADQMVDFPTYTKVSRPSDDVNRLDRAVDHIFDVLGSKPTNKLSRSPAFRQFYYRRVGEMLPYVDNATRDDLVRAMRDAGVSRGEIKAALKKSMDNPGANDLASADVDQIAKAFALQETKRLLYDLTKKTQFFDITRNIFPFGEAWFEIMTTWGRLINENPAIVRRIQQGIEGARQEGIFYNDPATGEEVFGMPHINALSSLMGVAPADGVAQPEFTGRVEGVNLVLNSFLPGVGPVVQIPAAAFTRDLFDKPEMRWARDLVFPFGYPASDSPGDIVNSTMPAWFRKALTSMGKPTGDDQRLYNNTVIDVLRAMELNGEITPTSDPSEAIEEARSRARKIYTLRFLQQFVGPTGPSVRWDVKVDPTGEAFAYQVLATEYREMIEAAGGDRVQAFYDFVNMYGFDPAGLATAKTEQVRPRAVTEQGLDFQQQNPELFGDYPLTAYYVAPDPPDGQFNYNAYLAQLRSGDRVGLTPDQWLTERNRLLGSIAYEKVRRAAVDFGIRDHELVGAYLRAYRYNLMEQYPGYGFDNVGVVTQPEQRQYMAEFEKWRSDPQLMETSVGQGLNRYLEIRDYAIQLANSELGVSEEGFASAKSTAPLREYLLNVGQQVISEYPEFGVIFQRHYLWEIEEPEPVAPTELLGVDLTGPDTDDEDEDE